ncbi:hypothetical protein [Prosthecobacter sp.]|uniref:hypothetical protein n=1 Tax=Prosthecobacter sp. TaxID=1965333 RepID=UPI00248A34E1|nr:hypothetical protein [Prosthecobacter sp.]MDI1315122.1 hypothetical protein [Prosthecobacter sp.]
MKFSLQQMMMLGAVGTVFIVLLAMMNWRRAVYAAMIVALFEGAIRKWIFPQGSELVYFFKDIILFGAYLKFFMFPDPDIRAWRVRAPATLITVVCITLVMFGALNANIGSITLAGYGLKIYLWYVPLGFMIPLLFRNEAQMTTMLFRYSLFAIPICLLGAVQFVAGPGSWLNVYAASEFADTHQVATFGTGAVATARITGTFSYISGHAVFVQFFFILSLGLLTGINDKRRWVLLLGNLPLLVANGLMSGSRGAVFSMLIVGAIVGATSTVSKVGKARNTLPYLMLGAVLIVFGINVFFSKALTAFETRRTYAGDSTFGRIMYPVSSVLLAAKEVDLMGFGIGMSHPASMAMRSALKIDPPNLRCPVYDAETGQVLAELGWPGFVVWYLFRMAMVWQCWVAFQRSPPSMFRSLALGFFCYELLLLPGSFILNHTANVFACAAWGFCLIPNLESLVRRARPVQAPQQALHRRGSRVPRLHD